MINLKQNEKKGRTLVRTMIEDIRYCFSKARKDHNENLLSGLKLDGMGLEIGPLSTPAAPKAKGFHVDVIDMMTQEELIAFYKDNPTVNTARIEKVDYVWKSGSYVELTGHSEYYDWILASHVIEHMPDLIAFLCDCADLLKTDGVLSLAVPDKRFCFDTFRPISDTGKVIDAHLQKLTAPSVGTDIEAVLGQSMRGPAIAWNRDPASVEEDVHLFIENAEMLRERMMTPADMHGSCHIWCFTPAHLRLLIEDLYGLGLIPLRECGFFDTSAHEFFIRLSKNGTGPGFSRLDLLRAIRSEQGEW